MGSTTTGLPRTLIVSTTPLSTKSATGAAMLSLFGDWDPSQIAVVHHADQDDPNLGHESFQVPTKLDGHAYESRSTYRQVRRFGAQFRPQVIYFRTIDSPAVFRTLGPRLARDLNVPLVTHTMDDWLNRLHLDSGDLTGAGPFEQARADLAEALDMASANLVISPQMGSAMADDFGGSYEVFRNAIDPAEWSGVNPQRSHSTDGKFRIRYAGALAKDMCFDSVADMAYVVDMLRKEGRDMAFDITSPRPVWRESFDRELDPLFDGATHRGPIERDEYIQFLVDADLLVIPLNFDDRSIGYIRHSMSNKAPDYMAAGSPILVYGPPQSATVQSARQSGWGLVVGRRDTDLLAQQIRRIVDSPSLHATLRAKAALAATREFSAAESRRRFNQTLSRAVDPSASLENSHAHAARVPAIGPARANIVAVLSKAESKATSQIASICWYLAPVIDRIEHLQIITGVETPRNQTLPDYLPADGIDPLVHEAAQQLDTVIEWASMPLKSAVAEANRGHVTHALCGFSRSDAKQLGWTPSKQRHDVYIDFDEERGAASLMAALGANIDPVDSTELERSRGRIADLATQVDGRPVAVFGTGPSLDLVDWRDFRESANILCNSAVGNRAIVEEANPIAIVAADPVFHSSFGAYAARFRSELVRTLDATGAPFFFPARDRHIYRHYLPARLNNQMHPVGLRKSQHFNLKLTESATTTSTANILTLLMLPLALSISDRVVVAGCDGKPQSSNYFWGHSSSAQFDAELGTSRENFPGFFEIDYDAYYAEHLEVLERLLAQAEGQHKLISNYSPTFIPSLARRSARPALIDNRFDPRLVHHLDEWTALLDTARLFAPLGGSISEIGSRRGSLTTHARSNGWLTDSGSAANPAIVAAGVDDETPPASFATAVAFTSPDDCRSALDALEDRGLTPVVTVWQSAITPGSTRALLYVGPPSHVQDLPNAIHGQVVGFVNPNAATVFTNFASELARTVESSWN